MVSQMGSDNGLVFPGIKPLPETKAKLTKISDAMFLGIKPLP